MANHFDFDYRIAETPATHPTPTTAPDCHMLGGGSVIFKPADGQAVTSSDTTGVPTTGQATPDAHPTCYAATVPHDITVTGQGTVNVAPKALTASADISSGIRSTSCSSATRSSIQARASPDRPSPCRASPGPSTASSVPGPERWP